jgi:hypothetical protein
VKSARATVSAMRTWTYLALALLAVACMASTAAADGDPASDVLYTDNLYLPYDAPPPAAATALKRAIESAYGRHLRVKVAVIESQVDLGAVPSLWGKPSQYAKFLGTELETFYVGPLLIVMPGGFGIYDGGRSVAAEKRVLSSLSIKGFDSESLTRAAADAVGRLVRARALRSPDIKAPFAYAFPAVLHRGKAARLKFGVSDDSAWSKTVAQILDGSRVLATLKTRLVRVTPTKPVAIRWKVPSSFPEKGIRVCVTASDAAGNRSAKNCGPVTVS